METKSEKERDDADDDADVESVYCFLSDHLQLCRNDRKRMLECAKT